MLIPICFSKNFLVLLDAALIDILMCYSGQTIEMIEERNFLDISNSFNRYPCLRRGGRVAAGFIRE